MFPPVRQVAPCVAAPISPDAVLAPSVLTTTNARESLTFGTFVPKDEKADTTPPKLAVSNEPRASTAPTESTPGVHAPVASAATENVKSPTVADFTWLAVSLALNGVLPPPPPGAGAG